MSSRKVPPLLIDAISNLLENWGNVLVRTRQGGKMYYRPLSQIRDQRVVYSVVTDVLKAWREDYERWLASQGEDQEEQQAATDRRETWSGGGGEE